MTQFHCNMNYSDALLQLCRTKCIAAIMWTFWMHLCWLFSNNQCKLIIKIPGNVQTPDLHASLYGTANRTATANIIEMTHFLNNIEKKTSSTLIPWSSTSSRKRINEINLISLLISNYSGNFNLYTFYLHLLWIVIINFINAYKVSLWLKMKQQQQNVISRHRSKRRNIVNRRENKQIQTIYYTVLKLMTINHHPVPYRTTDSENISSIFKLYTVNHKCN